MRQVPVVVVVRLAFKCRSYGLAALILLALLKPVYAQSAAQPQPALAYRYADLAGFSKAQIVELLTAADQEFAKRPEGSSEIPLLLHGEEIYLFTLNSYSANKELVDLAAKLDALGVVDFQVCQQWMSARQLTSKKLPGFIEVVSSAGEAEARLKESGYLQF